MHIIKDDQIVALGISPSQCVAWVEESFRSKPQADMPAKISVHPLKESFYTAMPCFHPAIGKVGVKVISRIPGRVPSLMSKMMLFDAASGEMLALIDANWITAMRTGAVAALAAKTFVNDFEHAQIGIVGLGTVGCATLDCLFAINPAVDIWLLKYKDHAEKIQVRYPNMQFHVVDTREELVANTSALISAVTVMREQFLPEASYPQGYTLIPVHVCGFQDCDLAFDKIFGDDTSHMRNWKNFAHYRHFVEFSDVLLGKASGRTSCKERIISYNYGLGLHDLWFASHILRKLDSGK